MMSFSWKEIQTKSAQISDDVNGSEEATKHR